MNFIRAVSIASSLTAMASLGSASAMDFKADGSIESPAARLSMDQSGAITLSVQGKDSYRIHMSMAYASGKKWFTTSTGSSIWRDAKVTVSQEAKTTTFAGETLPPGSTQPVALSFSMKAMDGGKALISAEFKSARPLSEALSLSNIHVHSQRASMEGCQFEMGGLAYPLAPANPAAKSKSVDILKGSKEPIAYFANSPERKVIFKPLACSKTWLRDCCGEASPYVELRFEPEGSKISFEIELDGKSAGSMLRGSGETYGGVDFWAASRLRMPDYNSCLNLVQNPGFEDGFHYWQNGPIGSISECPEGEYFSIVEGGVSGKGHCASIRGIMGQDPAQLSTFAIPLTPGETYTLSFYVKASKPDCRMIVRASSFVWPVFPIETELKAGTEWTRKSFTFKAPNKGVAIGFGLSKSQADCALKIDCVQLEKGPAASEYVERKAGLRLVTAERSNWLQPGAKVEGVLKIHAPANAAGEIEATVSDFYGKEELRKTLRFSANAEGLAEAALPDLERLGRGLHLVRSELRLSDGFATRDDSRFAIAPYMDGACKRKAIFSVGFADARQGNWERRTEYWRRAGIGSIINFLGVDPLPFDKLLKEKGILKVAGILKSGDAIGGIDFRKDFDHVAKLSQADLDAIRREAEATVKARPEIGYWKLMNEPPPEYISRPELMAGMVKAMLAAAEGARAANPKIKIISPDPANMYRRGIDFVDGFMAAGGRGAFDFPGIHPYRPRPELPDIDADAASFFDALKRRGYEGEVWFTEGIYHQNYMIDAYGLNVHNACSTDHYRAGCLSYGLGWGERMNAAYTSRSWLAGLKYSARVKMFVDWGFASNCYLDIDMTPGAATFAANTLSDVLGDSSFKSDIVFGGDVRCYDFDDGHGRGVFALWSYDMELDSGEGKPIPMTLKANADWAEAVDFMGVSRPLGKEGLAISSFPLFVRCPIERFDEMKALLSEAKMGSKTSAPCRAWLEPALNGELALQIKNDTGRTLKGMATLSAGGKTILEERLAIAPLQGASFRLKPETGSASFSGLCSIELDGEAERIETPLDLIRIDCPQTDGAKPFSGDPAKWPKAIEIANMKSFDPYNMEMKEKFPKPIAWKGPADLSAKLACSWDKEFLRIAIEVRDDVHAPAGGRPFDAWKGDSVQLYFDCWGDARSHKFKGYDNNDQSFIMKDAGNGTLSLFRDLAPEQQVAFLKTGPVESAKSSFRRTADGRSLYEIAIPWKELAPIEPKPGASFGFCALVNDCDGDYRKRALTLTPNESEPFMRPDLYPVMTLGDGK